MDTTFRVGGSDRSRRNITLFVPGKLAPYFTAQAKAYVFAPWVWGGFGDSFASLGLAPNPYPKTP